MSESPPVALTIAGSDNSAGAGVQADLKTFGALGVYGLTAMTCVVAEVPGKVSAVQPIAPEMVAQQIRLSLKAFPVTAIKTGLLHSAATIEIVCELLEKHARKKGPPPLVIDPVMIATSGDRLLDSGALEIYKSKLFPLASLITPNLDEVRALTNYTVTNLEKMREAGKKLVKEFGVPFLLKGGHLRGKTAVDLLFLNGKIVEITAPFIRGVKTHGTGCTYSAAIAAGLAKNMTLEKSVIAAKSFVTRAITNHFRWGKTHALNHLE